MDDLDFCQDCGTVLLDIEIEHCLGDVCFGCCEERHFVDEKKCKNMANAF